MKIIICGALGKMGTKIRENAEKSEDVTPLCGVDVKNADVNGFKVYDSFDKITEKADAVIDFSAKATLPKVLDYCVKTHTPVVLCSTGYDEKDIAAINATSEKIAIFRSANMSLGVNVLIEAVKFAAKRLYDFDIEIIEKHHNKKADAPSGTAIMIKDGIKEVFPDKTEVYGRCGLVGARDKKEIGIHAVRGGTIVGEHQVIFAGDNESLTFTHNAESRDVFAAGAIAAARFLAGKDKGLFSMKDLIG
ncbi:MAG: 4-hydroxy-tetrahydrodipicolinate reductase [Clostridia bacterium]|nr:4-hydroxy-tetrahydrodipicolinate reductase [Clostridia bacterium]